MPQTSGKRLLHTGQWRRLFPDFVGLPSPPTHLSTVRCAKAALRKYLKLHH